MFSFYFLSFRVRVFSPVLGGSVALKTGNNDNNNNYLTRFFGGGV